MLVKNIPLRIAHAFGGMDGLTFWDYVASVRPIQRANTSSWLTRFAPHHMHLRPGRFFSLTGYPWRKMSKKNGDKPTQETPAGEPEIPIPTREQFFRDLDKASQPLPEDSTDDGEGGPEE